MPTIPMRIVLVGAAATGYLLHAADERPSRLYPSGAAARAEAPLGPTRMGTTDERRWSEIGACWGWSRASGAGVARLYARLSSTRGRYDRGRLGILEAVAGER